MVPSRAGISKTAARKSYAGCNGCETTASLSEQELRKKRNNVLILFLKLLTLRLVPFAFSIHQRAGIRSDQKKEKSKTGVVRRVATIMEGKIMNLSVETKVAIAVATSFVVLIVGAMAQG